METSKLKEVVIETAQGFVQTCRPELADEFERYVKILRLAAVEEKTTNRTEAFTFDTEMAEASAAIILGIVGNLLTDLIKSASKKRLERAPPGPEKIDEIAAVARDVDQAMVEIAIRNLSTRSRQPVLVNEVVAFALKKWSAREVETPRNSSRPRRV